MGKLIKNHWARLIILTAAIFQLAAGIHGFFWPKIFWDFLTKNLDRAVKPVPILQIINVLLGLLGLAWEWPLKPLAGTLFHRSIEIRLFILPLSALASALLYQGTNPAIYYLIGMAVYFWGYSEGEVRYSVHRSSVYRTYNNETNDFDIDCMSRTVDLATAKTNTDRVKGIAC